MHTALRQKIVFVDPEDPTCPFWWPALIVPAEHLHLFPHTDPGSSAPSPDEIVVCYFEDGSFSVVPQSAMQPFSLKSGLYVKYRNDPELGQSFLQDRAVLRATKFWAEGIVPQAFSWLTSNAPNPFSADEELSVDHTPTNHHNRRKKSTEPPTAAIVNEKERKEYKMIAGLLPPSRIAIVKSIIQSSC